MEQHQDDGNCLAMQEPSRWHALLTLLCLYKLHLQSLTHHLYLDKNFTDINSCHSLHTTK